MEDVPDLRADDKAASVTLEFRAACKTYPRWLRTKHGYGLRERPPIFMQICWYFLPQMIPQFGWAFIRPFTLVVIPLFIRLLLRWATDRTNGVPVQTHVALLYVAGLFCAQEAASISQGQALIIGRRLCVRAKALIVAEVFTKTLRRKDLAGQSTKSEKGATDSEANADDVADADNETASAGRIQNLIAVDAVRVADLFSYIHWFPIEAPLTIFLATGLLFNTIGLSAFAAIATMVLLLPLQTVVARLFMRYQNQLLKASDDRLSLTNEVFQAIKAIKFAAWEGKFAQKLNERREAELSALRKRIVAFAANGIFLCGFARISSTCGADAFAGSRSLYCHLCGYLRGPHQGLPSTTHRDYRFHGTSTVQHHQITS